MATFPATSIGSKKIKDLLKDCRGFQQDMETTKFDMAGAISQAIEKDGLDRKVFALIRKLDKLSPEKLAAWEETFDDYYVKSGLKARADSAPSFQLEKIENGADEEEQQPAATKPKGPRKPKAPAEEAGDKDSEAALH